MLQRRDQLLTRAFCLKQLPRPGSDVPKSTPYVTYVDANNSSVWYNCILS